MEGFIEHVRAYPCLWNPLHPDYREMLVRDQAWQCVVKQYNNSSIPNIKVARIEWKKLRDNHREALKRAKLGQNKLLPAQITTWKYAKAMQFLEPHMKYRITENIDMDPPTGTSLKSSDHDVSTTEIAVENYNNTKTDSRNKRRRADCTTDSPARIHYEHESDALESFFDCLLKSTREMPQWMQTQVKKKIFAIIIEAEECLTQNGTGEQYDNNFHNETKIKSEIGDNT